MLSNNQLKYYSSLKNKKYRKIEGKFIVEGKRLVSELLSSEYKTEVIIITEKFSEQHKDFISGLKESKLLVETIKEKEFNKLSETLTPQGIVAIVISDSKKHEIKNENLIVALENISDPGNLGTILRNCDWFGIQSVILSENCAELFNSKVLRSSMGAVFNLNITETNDFIGELKGLSADYKIITADMNGRNLFEEKNIANAVVVMCNEANGPSDELLAITDFKLTIPKIGKVESLNVASASAVILSQITR